MDNSDSMPDEQQATSSSLPIPIISPEVIRSESSVGSICSELWEVNSQMAPREAEIRRAMLEIQSDASLDIKDKAKRMQELMVVKLVPKRPNSRNSETTRSAKSPSELDSEIAALDINDDDTQSSYYSKEKTEVSLYGCSHYRTACKIRAECCDNWYVCRFCHDEAEDHTMDRFAVKFCLCMHCKSPQKSTSSCQHCKLSLALYFCGICNLWDDDPSKEIFHCKDCGICRRGKREDYIHCQRCSGCIKADHHPNHKCLDGSLQSSCPICGENLFTTTTPVMFMPCGHAIHFICHQEHTKNSYQCPICLKSLSNMTHFFNRIDELMASQQMPEEYARVFSHILCNDCEKKSVAKFHFVYHRCVLCNSYNTKLLKTFNEADNAQLDPPSNNPSQDQRNTTTTDMPLPPG